MERRNEQLISAFAGVLQELRRAKGLSQEELAFRTDLSMSYISLLETKRRQPTLSVLGALSKELGVTISELAQKLESQ
jgi:transcriptional regulator with XRE-family HTH domain